MNLNKLKVACVFLALTASSAFAGTMDAGLIGPNGEVILFYKSGDSILIKECVDYTILNNRTDCEQKPGTSAARVPVQEFKNRLKAVLKLPVGNYTADMKRKIELYKKGKLDDIAELERQRAEVKAGIDRIQAFIDTYGQKNANLPEKTRLEERLDRLDQQLADNSDLAQAIREINRLVDTLVDDVISSSTLTKFVFSQQKMGFEFNILKSYLQTPGISASFADVRAGTFEMGSPSSEVNRGSDEKQHRVTLTKDFQMQTTEVTQLQYFLVMGYNPSYFKEAKYCENEHLVINGTELCPNNPVEQVSWNDTQDFIKKLNEGNDGYAYRLPTEAEWEFAARGGTQTAYSFGDDVRSLTDNGWYDDNSSSQSHAVGSKRANQYDLYDMHGNVWEWVQDWYASYSTGSQRDPVGRPASGWFRVIRGGSWYDFAEVLRSAYRGGGVPGARSSALGFRLVRTPR